MVTVDADLGTLATALYVRIDDELKMHLTAIDHQPC